MSKDYKEILKRFGKNLSINLGDLFRDRDLDDADYVSIVKNVIIRCIDKASTSFRINKKDRKLITDELISFNRDMFVELHLADTLEQEEELTEDEIRREAIEYFNYMFKND